jgi:ketosteroid isomerase-like protein
MILQRGVIFSLLSVASIGSAFASDTTDIMSIVQQTVDASNKNDVKALLSDFASSLTVVEDTPPYLFQGKTEEVLANEDKALSADSRSQGITDFSIKLSAAKFVSVSGTNAYAVIPGVYSFYKHDQLLKQSAVVTVLLRKAKGRWLINTWIWSRVSG